MTEAEKRECLERAKDAYSKAKLPQDVAAVMVSFGQNGCGWKPVCRVLFGGWSIDDAVIGRKSR